MEIRLTIETPPDNFGVAIYAEVKFEPMCRLSGLKIQQKSSAFSLRKVFRSLFELYVIHDEGSSFLMFGLPPETELNPFVVLGWERIRSRIEKSQNE